MIRRLESSILVCLTYKSRWRLKTACGSPCYAAHKWLMVNNPMNHMVDIWSAGIAFCTQWCADFTIWRFWYRKHQKRDCSGEYSVPNHLSNELRDFWKRVLTVDPKKRIRPCWNETTSLVEEICSESLSRKVSLWDITNSCWFPTF